jgi:hypothetical protein
MAVDTEKARRGLMKFMDKKGGSVPMGELHTHSTLFYQAGHQAFSELMEGLVAEQLVAFDDGTFSITDKGRASISE